MNQNCGNTTTTNNSTSQIINLKESIAPETAPQYHAYINTFIANSFPMFFGPHDPFVQTLVEKAVGEVKRASTEFGLPCERAPGIVKLALYDFVILYNSLSMRKHKKVLKTTLLNLARLSTLLAPVGISIRFLNHLWGCNGDSDNLLTAEAVEGQFSEVWFYGFSKLGTTLSKKIVQPMIIKKAEERTLKSPVITMIITDGEPSGERRETLRDTIQSCKQSMALQSYGKAAAVFVVSRIGNSTDADKFIGELQSDKTIADMTYCSREALDEQQEVFKQCGDNNRYTGRLIELFLTALER